MNTAWLGTEAFGTFTNVLMKFTPLWEAGWFGL
jgi:hypothetical protein